METSAPIARSEIFELPHIGQDKLKNMKELISRQNFPEKKKLMIEVFNSLQKGTTFQVIERNKNNEDGTDVILRQDTGSGGGHKGPRFPHGTPIELVSSPGRRENNNGYSFRTMKDEQGQERIYVQVKVNSQLGYMAIEHIGIKSVPTPEPAPKKPEPTDVVPPAPIPAEKPKPTDVVPPKLEPKPTTDKTQDVVPAKSEPTPKKQEPENVEPATPETKARSSVTTEAAIKYGDFAKKYHTTPDALNALNSLDLSADTLLAKGSELYIPSPGDAGKRMAEGLAALAKQQADAEAKAKAETEAKAKAETEAKAKADAESSVSKETPKQPGEKTDAEKAAAEAKAKEFYDNTKQDVAKLKGQIGKTVDAATQKAKETATEIVADTSAIVANIKKAAAEQTAEKALKEQQAKNTILPPEWSNADDSKALPEVIIARQIRDSYKVDEQEIQKGLQSADPVIKNAAEIRQIWHQEKIAEIKKNPRNIPLRFPSKAGEQVISSSHVFTPEQQKNITQRAEARIAALNTTEKGVFSPENTTVTPTPETQEALTTKPEIIFVNNKIYQLRGPGQLGDYIEMYVDPKDNTLKSYSYLVSKKHDFRNEFRTGKVQGMSYQDASKLASSNTDKKGYIWIPDQNNIATGEKKSEPAGVEAEIISDLSRRLASTFDSLQISPEKRKAILSVMEDKNLRSNDNLLSKFIFEGNKLQSSLYGEQTMKNIDIENKTLIITFTDEKKLYFTPKK